MFFMNIMYVLLIVITLQINCSALGMQNLLPTVEVHGAALPALDQKTDLMQPGDWVAQTWETYSIVYRELAFKTPNLLCTRFADDIHQFCRVVEFCSKLRSELCIREVWSVIPVHVINQRLQMVILPMFPKPF